MTASLPSESSEAIISSRGVLGWICTDLNTILHDLNNSFMAVVCSSNEILGNVAMHNDDESEMKGI